MHDELRGSARNWTAWKRIESLLFIWFRGAKMSKRRKKNEEIEGEKEKAARRWEPSHPCHTPSKIRFVLLPFVAVDQTVQLNGYELWSGYGDWDWGSPVSAHIKQYDSATWQIMYVDTHDKQWQLISQNIFHEHQWWHWGEMCGSVVINQGWWQRCWCNFKVFHMKWL